MHTGSISQVLRIENIVWDLCYRRVIFYRTMHNEKTKLIFFVSLASVAVIVMCVLAHFNIRNFEQHTVRQTQDHLLTIANVQAMHVENVFNEIKSDLEIIALTPAVRKRIIENLGESKLPSDEYFPLEDIFNRFKKVASSFYRIDSNGIIQQRVPFAEGREGANFSHKPGVAYVLANHKSHISKVFLTNSGERAVSICVPVFNDKDFIGILRGIAYLDRLSGIFSHLGDAEGAAAIIVNEDGEVLTYSEDIIETDTLLTRDAGEEGDEDVKEQVVTEILSGTQGTACLRFDELAYDKSVIAWSPIQVGQKTWSIIVCEDYDNISEPIKAHSRNIFIVIGCFSSVLIGIAVAFHRINKKKSQLEAYISLNKMNEELQYISDERSQTVTELEEQDKLFKNLIAAVPNGIFWKDSKSRYIGCNKSFAVLMGLEKPEHIIGKTDYQLETSRERADLYVQYDKEVMKTGIPLLNVEETYQLPDGAEVHLLVSKLPLRNVNGRITGVIGVFTDITELKKAQQETVDKGKTLTNIISCMQQGMIITDSLGKVTEVNQYYADHLGKSIDQIKGKDISECLLPPLNKRLTQLKSRLKESSTLEPELFCREIGDRDFQFRFQPIQSGEKYDGMVISVIDVSELTKARERAEYASYRKGQLLASLSHQIRTPMNSIVGFAELLDQENLSDEQAEFTKMISSSVGNLLEVVNEIVELASEHLEDIPNVGNEKDSANPPEDSDRNKNEEDAVGSADDDSSEEDKSEDSYRVLIVDDVPENRMLIEVLLKKQKYVTTSCNNGKMAVKLAAKEQFDLILMDIQMPEMNGMEATKIIRSEGMNSSTPVIAMTASVDTEDEMLCIAAGCDDYVRKPINKESLLRKIWRFSEQKKQIAAALEGGDIVSFLSGNPDYHKAIETFVDNLPERIREMQKALDEENLQDLNFKAHTLKGLGGFAGFPIYSEMAKSIEQALKDSQIDQVKAKLDEMVSICRRTKLTPR